MKIDIEYGEYFPELTELDEVEEDTKYFNRMDREMENKEIESILAAYQE